MNKRIVIFGLLSGLSVVCFPLVAKNNNKKLPSWAENIITTKIIDFKEQNEIRDALLDDLVGAVSEWSKDSFEKANRKKEVEKVKREMMSLALKYIEDRYLRGGKGPMSKYFTKAQLINLVRPVVKKYRDERLQKIKLFF